MPQIIELLVLIVIVGMFLSAVVSNRSKKKTPEFLAKEAERVKEKLEAHRASLRSKKESLLMKKQGIDLLNEEIRITAELDKVSKELQDVEKELGCVDPDASGSMQTENCVGETNNKTLGKGR